MFNIPKKIKSQVKSGELGQKLGQCGDAENALKQQIEKQQNIFDFLEKIGIDYMQGDLPRNI